MVITDNPKDLGVRAHQTNRVSIMTPGITVITPFREVLIIS